MSNQKLQNDFSPIVNPVSFEFDEKTIQYIKEHPIQPCFDYAKIEKQTRQPIDNFLTFEDRVNYAKKVFNKNSFFKNLLIAVLGGVVVLALEHWKGIYDFIISLLK